MRARLSPGPTLRIEVTTPPGWTTRRHPGAGILVAARGPRSMSGPAPELVVRAVPVDVDGLDRWRDQAVKALGDQVPGFALEDDDSFDLDGRPVRYHRFAHRFGTAEAISEQWSWCCGGFGITLTATVDFEDYLLYCELFEEVAATVTFVESMERNAG